MVVRIAGKRMYLWRAVDHEGIELQKRADENRRSGETREAAFTR
jgi:transposase-like protein